MQWVAEYGIPAFSLALAAALTTVPLTKWVLDKMHARDLQRKVRQNLTPGAFREVNALEALQHIRHQSAWAWQQYAILGSWERIEGLQLQELRRAAMSGEVITLGRDNKKGLLSVINQREWWDGKLQINSSDVTLDCTKPNHVPQWYAQLTVAEADIKQVWPVATSGQKLMARIKAALAVR